MPSAPRSRLPGLCAGLGWDVAVDLRPGSPSGGEWHAVELSPGAANALPLLELKLT
ncbi:dTDP-4-dehydrorhamnose 3,5-epimerase family protein [Synechococcus sp. CBW1108]|uniref:dTDP-4-dehydrorhamnose 3,5-epimerase family protein n=1 Tax=Synechococcus sp. CBW1108 TaxID=1353147 RepID=UPI001E5F7067|nr:dTDP-4-dehydrorhamnose 3,5-epimerase family protein [Synechococcus sp. CBW1108]